MKLSRPCQERGRLCSVSPSSECQARGQVGHATRELGGLRFVLNSLGLILPDLSGPTEEAPAEVIALAGERWAAKQSKNWAESDRLRDALATAGWEVKDTKEGYELCPKN